MRLNRILYVGLLFLAFTLVYLYGGKVPYMLFYTVLALPVVSFSLIAAGYMGIKYEQTLDSSSVVKGGKVTFTLRIANMGLFILPYVSIQCFGGDDALTQQPCIKNISLQPFSKREFCFEHEYKYRGCYELGVSAVEIQDFLGIFKLVRRNKRPLLVTVYPRIIHIDNLALSLHDQTDTISNLSSLHEDVSTIEDINPYSYGDSLNKIHWKLTAKVNELMVKKYQNTAAGRVLFIVDLEESTFASESKAVLEDKHIEAVLAVLGFYLHRGAAVRLVYQAEEIRTIECNNPLDFENVCQALAEVRFNQEVRFTDLVDRQINYGINKPNLLLATSNVNYGLYEMLGRVKSVRFEISLFYISPEEMTGEKRTEVEQILSALSGLGIKVYRINISDDIKGVLEYGGR